MKKTLAAVLAAMMALSTATVALAADRFDSDATLTGTLGTADEGADATFQEIGSDEKYPFGITAFGGCANGLTPEQLGALIDEGAVKVSVKITDGRKNLAYLPTVTEVGNVAQLKLKFAHNYKPITEDEDPVSASLAFDITFTKDVRWDYSKNTFTSVASKTQDPVLDGMGKGDTVHVDAVEFEAAYNETDDYGTDMTFTKNEVSALETVIFADKLIEELDGEELTLYFGEYGDLAAWNGKISDSQKDLNVYYTMDAIEGVPELAEELEIEPEYITFMGDVKFYKTGTLTFNAIGGEDTVVYEVVDGELVPMTTEYDSTYDVVTVDGVKKLTSYVIASEELVVEVEEPVVEEPAVEEENPNTGAC